MPRRRMTNVAINGLGRIGRAAFKIIMETDELDLVAVNDIMDIDTLHYLLKYDSIYGRYDKEVSIKDGDFLVDDTPIKFLQERDPADLPWKDLGVEIVFECSGVFRNQSDLEKHISAGASYAILSAPLKKGEDVPTVIHGTNQGTKDQRIISCASCTTNSITPIVDILSEIGIKKATLTTVHGYTGSQNIHDGPNPKTRRGRAAAVNLVPTSTGAAIATTKALPQYEGRFDGRAIRAPVPVGSISDLVFVLERDTTEEEVNKLFTEAAAGRYKDVVGVTNDPIVSSDIIGDTHASVVDLQSTMVIDGDLLKIFAFYDNEWGYTSQMIREAKRIAKAI